MPRKKNNIHYLYKTTCKVTGRWYIGMHSTSNLDDGYLGSGKRLRYSIRKYGESSHVKEILEFFNTRELLVEAEIKAITQDMINDPNCMNLTDGGSGGNGFRFLTKEQQRNWIDVGKKAFLKKMEEDEDFRNKRLEVLRIGTRKAHEKGKYKYDNFKGKKHSEESKFKMRKSKNSGVNNSQFGKCWITNEKENKKINRGDEIPDGWRLGRVLK